MKEYLKKNLPKTSLIFVIILFVTNFLTLMIPQIGEIVLLYPSNLSEPLNWYRFFTYPLYVGGLITWIHNSIVIILTGFIIENKIKRKDLISLILLSSFVGGLIFIILNQNNNYNLPIAAPTMISWGYWSATIIIGLKSWKSLNLFEKIVLVLCALSILSIWNDNIGFFMGQISVIVIIGIITIAKYEKK
ncbi:rhomboid family intramembrane serine protease [Mariniphaga sediminis]|uniref:Rhomboid family intramembrane serine protease n=1 Tax=Mariniphaga sediminis TaxID=1628158 RepID=A0A399CU67_9BACT|nr:rhomboid family intramembrane serine protease [Mariniphaga sediminis]RIH62708.1 rhomboid family intramembrane serine protease [Mariniphaga sediminis]